MMKINSFLVFFLFLVFKSNAQKIYAVDHASQADVKVFVADYQSQADLLVYKVHYASQLGKNDGNWFYVKYKSQSKWVKDKNKHLFY